MDILCQLQADQLGIEVARASVGETTALGAAYLAGLGVGLWSDAAEVSATWSADRRFTPSGDREALDAEHGMWLRAVKRSLDWAPA